MKYEIKGTTMPVVICQVDPHESMICKAGAMCWMSPNMELKTINGSLEEMASSLIEDEDVEFQNRYVSRKGPGMIAFAPSHPCEIMAIEVSSDSSMICQSDVFLASTEDVEMDDLDSKALDTGILSEQTIDFQKLSGSGTVFLAIQGDVVEYNLEEGQQMVVDTAHFALADDSVKMSLRELMDLKNVFFSGERRFLLLVTGPGRIILQTMPLSGLGKVIKSAEIDDDEEEEEEEEEK